MIVVGWGNTKQTYIIWRFIKGWEMQDYREAFDKTANLVMSRKNIPVMVDMREVGSRNLLSMAYESLQYRRFLTNRVIFIGSLNILRPVYIVLSGVLAQKGLRISLVENMDDAYQIIMRDEALPS